MGRWESFTDAELEKLSEITPDPMRQEINEVLDARASSDTILARFKAFNNQELVALRSALGNSSFDASFLLQEQVKSELERRTQRPDHSPQASIIFSRKEAVVIAKSLAMLSNLDSASKLEVARVQRRLKMFFKAN